MFMLFFLLSNLRVRATRYWETPGVEGVVHVFHSFHSLRTHESHACFRLLNVIWLVSVWVLLFYQTQDILGRFLHSS